MVSKDEGFQKALEEYTYLLDGEKSKPKFIGSNMLQKKEGLLQELQEKNWKEEVVKK